MRLSRWLLLLAPLLLSACASPQIIKSAVPFDREQASEMLKVGTNTIKGSALIRQNNGATVTCEGNEVELLPATKYAEDRIQQIYGSTERGFRQARGFDARGFDPDYATLTRLTVCNAQGFFTFSGVSDGDFFITTSIVWRTNPYLLDGGVLMKRVRINGGREIEVVLAP